MPKLSPSAIEKNKGRIEEAAKKLFIKQGFHATSMRNHIQTLGAKSYQSQFEEAPDGWRIAEALRRNVRFQPHNLLEAPPSPGDFDIVLCRNVLLAAKAAVVGAVTFPTGKYASNRRCELDSGLRYITSGQHDLGEAHALLARA